MKQFIPARPLLFSVLLLLLAMLVRPAQATHLLGGEMTYRYLDADGPDAAPLRYEITIIVYNNCASTSPAPSAPYPTATVGLYNKATGAKLTLTTANYVQISGGSLLIDQTSITNCISPVPPVGCPISSTTPPQPYKLQKFIAVVNLPDLPGGFYAVYSESARNNGIVNIPGTYFTLYTELAPKTRPNRSPIFANVAVAVICANDTTLYLNNAIDADGDRLEYSFGQPYGGALPTGTFTPPPTVVAYNNATFTANTPFGTTGPGTGVVTQLNANSGIATLATPRLGNYVVAVDVKEYRMIGGQEVLIGTTRRDVQLVVATCPPSAAPALPPPSAPPGIATLPREYTIVAGDVVTLPITAYQAANNSLTLTATSELLDGIGGYDATFNGNQGTLTGVTGTASVTANAPASATFRFKPDCFAARTNPYDVTLSVQDNGCAGKTIFAVFRITVVPPTGPTTITGDGTICGANTLATYTAGGGNATAVAWTVTNGTIVGSATANPVQVRWGALGTGTITAQGSSTGGCVANSVSKTVNIVALPTLAVAGTRTICLGTSTTITPSGAGTGATYTVTGGPVTGSGTTFVLTPTVTTTYTVASTSPTSCPGTTQVVITVNPRPAANVGTATRATCSQVPLALGAPAVTGSTYLWTGLGLSSTTVANPTITVSNTTNAPITQTYTLTETSAAGCIATNTVVVTINPAAVAVPGAAVAICSGASASLGAAAVTGNTYSWSPSTGLSSSTAANPTVTLTNTTTANVTQTYTLTTTNATGCVATNTVVVTVYPAVVANTAATATTIGGKPVMIGAAPVAGFTYSWSPSTGLSSSTIANPLVTLTNYTGAPITQTYTLTTTNTATGCSNTASVVVTINVDQTLVIPNIITPNGDGFNDKLHITNVLSFPGSTLEIYNRWGRQVFTATNYPNDTWGSDDSVAAGLYYYMFKQANGSTTKGWIEVVK